MKSNNKKKKLFGHPLFYELTRQEEELHSTKNKDYANIGDPMRNFRSVAKIAKGLVTPGNEDVKIALIYLLKQLDATVNLISEEREGGVEGVMDRATLGEGSGLLLLADFEIAALGRVTDVLE